jgi:YD repeat-containing protein
MTDGLGSMSYQYDALSRLTSETRTITGVGTFPLSYAYNLSGALTSITDPFGAQVGYVHDQSGRLTSVTGSNFPNVSTYASNFQYRASGALKHLVYGNNRPLDLGYNSRLQASSFQIPSLINKTYQYNADGSLKYSQDLLDAKLDRSYGYDHAARMTQAFSGAEARGEGATDDRPYKETMTHDVWGHEVGREKKHWAVASLPTSETYNNNRNSAWTYDADGRLLQTGVPTITYAYDAAGRMSHTNSDSRVDITQTHDGDGQILKRYEVDTIYEEGQPPHNESSTLYQLRSSVLGGKLLTEIGAQGQKFRTYVYANGALLAWQQVVYVNGVVTYEGPMWEHRDTSNASYRVSAPTYVDPENSAELDPFGSNMGLETPYHFPPDPPPAHKPNIFYPGFGLGSDVACRVDALETPCADAMQMVNAHAAHATTGSNAAFSGEYLIFDVRTNVDGNGFYQHMRFVGISIFAEPQNPVPTPTPCAGSIPEAAGRAILAAADQEHVDPTLLSVTWRHEAIPSFGSNPQPNPRLEGSGRNRRLVGWDVGPMQISTNYYQKSPFIDGLPGAYGTIAMNNSTRQYEGFNGTVSDNLRAGARAFTMDILGRSNSNADAAGLFRAGSRTGPGYRDRFNEYTREAPGDRAQLNCLRGR